MNMLVLGLALAASASASRADDLPPVRTVPSVDLARYLGTWYEIALFPQRFEKGCTETRATYTLRPDGDIDVVNDCVDCTSGRHRIAHGRAWVTDRTTNAKLRVRFFWPFSGKYWIIDLGENYEYAVVGHPSRTYLWILCRKPVMDAAVYAGILERLKAASWDVTKLSLTKQTGR
jgi:apolipoprotein D and lipocalin family protein